LLIRNPRKPSRKISSRGAFFKILKQRRYRYSGASKDPSPTNALRIALYGRTGRPIEHKITLPPFGRSSKLI